MGMGLKQVSFVEVVPTSDCPLSEVLLDTKDSKAQMLGLAHTVTDTGQKRCWYLVLSTFTMERSIGVDTLAAELIRK